MPERVTIADVARRAKVSPTTVSYVLSGNRPVGAQTRERVERVIEELDYRPSSLARSLRTSKSQTIALIIPNIGNPFYPALARAFQDVLRARDYHVFICNTDAQRSEELGFLEDLRQRRVDGIAMTPLGVHSEDLTEVLQDRLPFVSVGIDVPETDTVLTDDAAAAHEATTHLLRRGHRRVATVAGPPGLLTGDPRLSGYTAALADAGVRYDSRLVVRSDHTRAGGKEATLQLLRLPERRRPTAVFCANDLMAIGALDAAREVGLTVPTDLAVVGFDDIEAASLVTPALTTVRTPSFDIGQAAADLLLERLAGSTAAPRRIVVPTRLIERASA